MSTQKKRQVMSPYYYEIVVVLSYFLDEDTKLRKHYVNVLRTKSWKAVELEFETNASKFKARSLKA